MLQRTLTPTLTRISRQFPAVLLTGARQVGKTTLLDICAKSEPKVARSYITLDDLSIRSLAQTDPQLLLARYPGPLIIDEVQYAPELFSAIKMRVDQNKRMGEFWLTGSQKFHLMKGVAESLAGRVAILELLGLSAAEVQKRSDKATIFLPTEGWLKDKRSAIKKVWTLETLFRHIWLGSYPHLNTLGAASRDVFYRSYIQTYVQRDVQDLLRVSDHNRFYKFLTSVAARTGQLLNYTGLARDADIDNKTAMAWLSVLEASGLVYLMRPYHTNQLKRLVKTPKLYFLDTGLACYLTRWGSPETLEAGALSGAILETWVVGEIIKSYWNQGLEAPLYFYRDTNQVEIDVLIEQEGKIHPVEIKKTSTPLAQHVRSFKSLTSLAQPLGAGALLCVIKEDIPLAPNISAIPIGYL